MNRVLYHCFYLCMLLFLAGACTDEDTGDAGKKEIPVSLKFSRSVGTTEGDAIEKLRVFAFDENGFLILNKLVPLKSELLNEEDFELGLKTGKLSLYAVGNEREAWNLDGVKTIKALENFVLKGEDLKELPLVYYTALLDVQVKLKSGSETAGEVSTDGGQSWGQKLKFEMQRVVSRIDFSFTKNTEDPDIPVIVEEVHLMYVPKEMMLGKSEPYDGIKGYDGILNADKAIEGSRLLTFDGGALNTNVSDRVTSTGLIVMPEFPGATADVHCLLIVKAKYNGVDCYYQVPLGEQPYQEPRNYEMRRNRYYKLSASIEGMGSLDPGGEIKPGSIYLTLNVVDWERFDSDIVWTEEEAQVSFGPAEGNNNYNTDVVYNAVNEDDSQMARFKLKINNLPGAIWSVSLIPNTGRYAVHVGASGEADGQEHPITVKTVEEFPSDGTLPEPTYLVITLKRPNTPDGDYETLLLDPEGVYEGGSETKIKIQQVSGI